MTFFIACSSAVGLSGSTLNFHVLFYSLANFDRLLGEVFSARAERFVPACAPSQVRTPQAPLPLVSFTDTTGHRQNGPT